MEGDRPKIMTTEELLARATTERRAKIATLTWGAWRLDPEEMVLTHTDPQGHTYDVAVDDMVNSAEVLDWIFQVHHKQFATPQVMADFLAALDALLKPQANICSMGNDKECDPEALVQKFLASG